MNLSPSYLFLMTAIAFNVLTSTFFKLSSLKAVEGTKSTLLFVLGLLFGLTNAYYYTKSLKTIDLNVAYPIFSTGSIAVLCLVSYFLFKEQFTINKVTGLICLMVGMYMISKG